MDQQQHHRRGCWSQTYHGFPISVEINLDGRGKTTISTGIGFLDHILDLFGRYSSIDLSVTCKGDLHVDDHHTIDEVGIALGSAINEALRVKHDVPIQRQGFQIITMDECLTTVALDLCGRCSLVFDIDFEREHLGMLSTEMIPELLSQLCQRIPMTLIVKSEYGHNDHHKAEGLFKALGLAFKSATTFRTI